MTSLFRLTELYAGGPGSGCQGPNCGRPKTQLQSMLEQSSKAWGPKNLWSLLAKHGHAGVVAPFSAAELKQLKTLVKSAGFKGAGDCKIGFCFMNAQRLAIVAHVHRSEHVELVEGLVTVHGVPLDHSWIEYNGKVYDPTLALYQADKAPVLKRGDGRYEPEYFGVNVPKDAVIKHQLATGMYSPLSHSWGNEELQKRIWK